jgi:hypothetical protein
MIRVILKHQKLHDFGKKLIKLKVTLKYDIFSLARHCQQLTTGWNPNPVINAIIKPTKKRRPKVENGI